MSRSSVCRLGLFCFLFAGVGLSLPGCSKQGEGERCDLAANGSEDCDEGLVCVMRDTDRCCPPDMAAVSDARCNATSTSTGGSSSGGKSSGGSSSGGKSSGGSSSGGSSSGGSSSGGSGEGGSGADGDSAGANTGGNGG